MHTDTQADVTSWGKHLDEDERAIVARAVDDALSAGFVLSVRDSAFGGGEWVVKGSRSRSEILSALGSTESDLLQASDGAVATNMWAVFIWGNGVDCLSDWANGEATRDWLSETMELSENLAAA